MRLVFALSVAIAACATSPAIRSPLRERLSVADNSQVEQATRACLETGGWKVDPIAEIVNGARRVSATKAKDLTEVYINPPDVKPRVTGGPDWDADPFWKCLGYELGKKPSDSPSPSSDSP